MPDTRCRATLRHGTRVDPHRFLREIESGALHVAENADRGTGLAFHLLVPDIVGTAGEHDREQQQSNHHGENHQRDPRDPTPMEHDAADDDTRT